MKTLLAICRMLTSTSTPLEAEQRRQDRDEEPGIDAVEQHLEDAVEGHQPGRVLGVALGQLVPDDDHGDAAGQADHDQPDHVLRIVAEESRCARTNIRIGPITQFCTSDRPSIFLFRKTSPISSYFTLAKRRVHHQDQADGDRDVGGADLETS